MPDDKRRPPSTLAAQLVAVGLARPEQVQAAEREKQAEVASGEREEAERLLREQEMKERFALYERELEQAMNAPRDLPPVDPDHIRRAFDEHRQRGDLPRWEVNLRIVNYLSSVAESNSLTIRFAPELGDVARLFPELTPFPGRTLSLRGSAIAIGISSKDSTPPPPDGGVQDAVLRTIVSELLPFVRSVERSRWTNSPFEENDPPAAKGKAAEDLLVKATRMSATVFFDLDFFSRHDVPVPVIEVHFVGVRSYRVLVSSAVPPIRRTVSLPAGRYEIRAVVRAWSQATCQPAFDAERSELWRSRVLKVELPAFLTAVLAVGVPAPLRALTPEERTFVEDPTAPLAAPREIIELAFAPTAKAQAYLDAFVSKPMFPGR